jgi:imidazoleglycerol-phosphate dehydratase
MTTKTRKTPINRKSTETQITGTLTIDGKGVTKIKTPIGLLSHMLELFAFHGFFDLNLEVKGDTHIDIHHTNEDIGIALGKAFKEALKDKKGIRRFGSGFAPMEDTLGHTVVDISGRGHFKISFTESQIKFDSDAGGYSFEHLQHFLDSFAKNLGANIIITLQNPGSSTDLHTIIETVFKSLGLALDQATQIDSRRKKTIPSTKGIID